MKNIYQYIKCKIYPLLQVGSGSREKVPDPATAGQKSPDLDPHHYTGGKEQGKRFGDFLEEYI